MIAHDGQDWEPRVKLSEQRAKTSSPGFQQVRRFSRAGMLVADAVYDESVGCTVPTHIIDPLDPLRRRTLPASLAHEDLLEPAVRKGKRVAPSPAVANVRARAAAQLASLDPSVKRLVNPHTYPAGLTRELYDARAALIEQAKGPQRDAGSDA
jgi:nicotinate phosphoribosyltransferase